MADKDLQQLRQVLREAVRASRMPIREMERQLGIGHGALYRMLDGELDLRVRHLLALADLLGVPPTDFFEIGCPDAMSRASRRLADWIGHSSIRASEPTAASLSLPELKELIRSTVREELDQQSATPSPSRRTRR
jgi:transcriptional regulator with XRE-family HTH domain